MTEDRDNFILQTDSYKWTHPSMFRIGTRGFFAYLEARLGGAYAQTLWFGALNYYLKRYLEGVRVTREDLEEAKATDGWHFARKQLEVAGWEHVIDDYGGRLPLRICAAPEGSVIPSGNVLLTVESTSKVVPWMVGHVEGLIEKMWYPMAVATKSWHQRVLMEKVDRETGSEDHAKYMLHDFGYRGATCEEQAKIGGGAHLLNFYGTDTMVAMRWLRQYYGAGRYVAGSVAAAEHTVMTQDGRDGEINVALHIIQSHPNQIVSLVADSYDYYRFVDAMIANKEIIDRNRVKLVIRPDSCTPRHPTPESLIMWTLMRLDEKLPGAVVLSKTGHKVLPYATLWGDGLDEKPIDEIRTSVVRAGYALSNMLFGMGGGLLQKVNRDTNRVAYKTSSKLMDDGKWHDMAKEPLDSSKKSKPGRITLTRVNGRYETVPEGYAGSVLRPVFENGVILQQETWDTVRDRAMASAVEEARRLATVEEAVV